MKTKVQSAKGNIDSINAYISRINEIFGTTIENVNLELPEISFDMQEMLPKVLEVLEEIEIYSTNDYALVVEYAGHAIKLAFANGDVKANYLKDFEIDLTARPSEFELVLPSADETIDTLLDKVAALKEYVEGNKYSVEFEFTYENLTLSGILQADLDAGVSEDTVLKP